LTLHSEVDGIINENFHEEKRAYSHQLITKSIEIVDWFKLMQPILRELIMRI
jgi:hypothetical protein